jgi:hypothetical protein
MAWHQLSKDCETSCSRIVDGAVIHLLVYVYIRCALEGQLINNDTTLDTEDQLEFLLKKYSVWGKIDCCQLKPLEFANDPCRLMMLPLSTTSALSGMTLMLLLEKTDGAT